MRVAVIPARGGSKRIPRKNIRPFAGVPMIGHAIGLARASGLFDRIVVSTDDDEIAGVARDFGAEVPFRRPAELADDRATTAPVVAHAIQACAALGWTAERVCCLYPCVPFLDPTDLADALALLDGSEADFSFPVAAFPSAVQRALRRGADGRMAPMYPEHEFVRTQDLEPAYHDAGQFYWGRTGAWLEGRRVHGGGIGLPVPAWRVIDIDGPDDWTRAELLHRALNDRSTHP
ncbi:MAG: pseudaminic acid cytidylyltransferase [Pseudomonadota bacterium]|jgi:pseudaminic acid cytidylyltransferase